MLTLKYCLSALFVGSEQSAFCSYHTPEREGEKEEVRTSGLCGAENKKKMEKGTHLRPNVLLAQIVELEGDCAKINTTFGFITTNRLSKIKNKSLQNGF